LKFAMFIYQFAMHARGARMSPRKDLIPGDVRLSPTPLAGNAVMKRMLFLLLAMATVGCGSSSTSPVAGVVLLDGKPVANAAVQFVAQSESGRDATGQTDQSGEFTMSTFKPKDGVVPGDYKVVVSPLGAADTSQYASAEEAMSAASKAAPKSAAPAFPQKYTRGDLTPLTQKVPVSGKLKLELTSK
jgi:hypothetical protein